MTTDPMADPRSAQILDIVASETGTNRTKLVPEARLADLDIASLDLVQTIFAIEDKFNAEIPVAGEGGGNEFQTVGDLLRHALVALGPAT